MMVCSILDDHSASDFICLFEMIQPPCANNILMINAINERNVEANNHLLLFISASSFVPLIC